MSRYTSIDHLKLGRVMLPSEIDAVEAQFPGTVDGVIVDVSGEANEIVRKRYPQLFDDFPACPVALSNRVAAIVVSRLWGTHGASPTNTDKTTKIEALEEKAWTWLHEAADGQNGLVELATSAAKPLESGVGAGAPIFYSEQSPYTWSDLQFVAGTAEDDRSRGR